MTEGEQIIKLLNALSISANKSAKKFEALGMSLTVLQWSAYSEIPKATISVRLLRGWNVERAVTQTATCGNNQFLIY